MSRKSFFSTLQDFNFNPLKIVPALIHDLKLRNEIHKDLHKVVTDASRDNTKLNKEDEIYVKNYWEAVKRRQEEKRISSNDKK